MAARLDPPVGPADHVRGPAGSPYVLVVYGDFECPSCQAAQSILARVRRRLGDELREVHRHFPLDAHHPLARTAAAAAEAAAAQGAFWPMHDALYSARGRVEVPELVRTARDLGLDAGRIEQELREGVHLDRVESDHRSGLRSGVSATPGFFAGGIAVTGAFDAGSLVEALRGAG